MGLNNPRLGVGRRKLRLFKKKKQTTSTPLALRRPFWVQCCTSDRKCIKHGDSVSESWFCRLVPRAEEMKEQAACFQVSVGKKFSIRFRANPGVLQRAYYLHILKAKAHAPSLR